MSDGFKMRCQSGYQVAELPLHTLCEIKSEACWYISLKTKCWSQLVKVVQLWLRGKSISHNSSYHPN